MYITTDVICFSAYQQFCFILFPFPFLVPRIEPKVSHVPDKCSPSEIKPQVFLFFFLLIYLVGKVLFVEAGS